MTISANVVQFRQFLVKRKSDEEEKEMGLDFELPQGEHEETPVGEAEDPNRVDLVEIYGPNGRVAKFVLKGNWSYCDNEVDIQGVDPEDGKAVYTAGLGGAFFAIVKER